MRIAARNLVISALFLFAGGCLGTLSATPIYASDGYVTYYDESPAYAIETYPQYQYNGTSVYLVGDRWYYRNGGRWAYYGDEPPQLYNYRSHYHASYGRESAPAYGAPPPSSYGTYRGAPHGYSGPAHGYAPPPSGYAHPGAKPQPPPQHKPKHGGGPQKHH